MLLQPSADARPVIGFESREESRELPCCAARATDETGPGILLRIHLKGWVRVAVAMAFRAWAPVKQLGSFPPEWLAKGRRIGRPSHVPITDQLRNQIAGAYQNGKGSLRAIAARFGTSLGTVQRCVAAPHNRGLQLPNS